ncbi:hypothetical protein NDU88_004539 [Pleurodeles waltl]|uniref:Uncharacterized protein n=1 Tax=Pleurodeles waltl TaxID=8319 RepID=A0AAV7UH19_PLEWA|nr:hypothetical protein NDU88_004539 [Pleurodeles waltl]
MHSSQGPSNSLTINKSCALRFNDAAWRLHATPHLCTAGNRQSAQRDALSHRLSGQVALEQRSPICAADRPLSVPGARTRLYTSRTAPSVTWIVSQPLYAQVEWPGSAGSHSGLHNNIRHSRLRRPMATPQDSRPESGQALLLSAPSITHSFG